MGPAIADSRAAPDAIEHGGVIACFAFADISRGGGFRGSGRANPCKHSGNCQSVGARPQSLEMALRDAPNVDLDTEINFSDVPRRYLAWLRHALGHDLLLVIDDLDRCPPEYVSETLSALHIMATVDHRTELRRLPTPSADALAVLVVAERKWLELAAEKMAPVDFGIQKGWKSIGAEFLEKIFIASVEIPRLHGYQRQTLVRATVDSQKETAQGSGQPLTDRKPDVRTASAPRQVEQIRAELKALDHVNTAAVATIVGRLRTLDPENRELMHMALVRRMNRPDYRSAEESQLLGDYAQFMESTPRGVKRTLVSFWLNRTLVRLVDLPREPSDESIMRWTILALRWPLVAERPTIINRDVWLADAEQALGAEYDEFAKVVDGGDVAMVGAALRP